MAGCSVGDWIQQEIPEPGLAEKRANEYQHSTSSTVLQQPSSVQLIQTDPYYVVPSTQADPHAMTNTLPPGSNIAQQELHLPERLALAQRIPISYKLHLTSHHNTVLIKVNQNFEDTWQALVLGLQAGHYIVQSENNNTGQLVVASPTDPAQSFILQTAIEGNWKRHISTISPLDMQQNPIPKKVARPIMAPLLVDLAKVTQLPHTAKSITVAITVNDHAIPILLMDCDQNVAYLATGKALKAAGYTIVKVERRKNAYYFVDTVSSHGAINSKMPVYGLYVRSNGVIARLILLDETSTFAKDSVAMPIFTNLGKQLVKISPVVPNDIANSGALL